MKTETPKHTPTPWKVTDSVSSGIIYNIANESGRALAGVYHAPDKMQPLLIAQANADHIVLCVNSHERLVKACGMAQYCLRSENGDIVSKEDIARTLKEIKAALAAAQPAPNHAPE